MKSAALFKVSLPAFCAVLLFHSASYAAVVMTGTRVVFPAAQNEKTIQLQNRDSAPNIVQIWLDKGDEKSTPDTADAPFLANPQIFKIAPNQGQMVRLIFTGDKSALPADRESLFYLNFSEIPAMKSADSGKNKLVVVFKNRLKVFYRPDRLAYPSHQMASHISYRFNGAPARRTVTISNNSPYFANISEAHLISGSSRAQLQKNTMIAPNASAEWDIPLNGLNIANARISLGLINDYGVTVTSELMQQSE